MYYRNHSLVLLLSWGVLLCHLACGNLINPSVMCLDIYSPLTVDLADCHHILSKFPVGIHQAGTSLPLQAYLYHNPARFQYRTCAVHLILSNPRDGTFLDYFPRELSENDMTYIWPRLQSQGAAAIAQCLTGHGHQRPGAAWGQLALPGAGFTHRPIAYRIGVGTPNSQNPLRLPYYDLASGTPFLLRNP